jgi:hypothetical protein
MFVYRRSSPKLEPSLLGTILWQLRPASPPTIFPCALQVIPREPGVASPTLLWQNADTKGEPTELEILLLLTLCIIRENNIVVFKSHIKHCISVRTVRVSRKRFSKPLFQWRKMNTQSNGHGGHVCVEVVMTNTTLSA